MQRMNTRNDDKDRERERKRQRGREKIQQDEKNIVYTIGNNENEK